MEPQQSTANIHKQSLGQGPKQIPSPQNPNYNIITTPAATQTTMMTSTPTIPNTTTTTPANTIQSSSSSSSSSSLPDYLANVVDPDFTEDYALVEDLPKVLPTVVPSGIITLKNLLLRFQVLNNEIRSLNNEVPVGPFLRCFTSLETVVFAVLGPAFQFAKTDLDDKVHAVEKVYNPNKKMFVTVQSMVRYEIAARITQHRDKKGGSRNVLRLYRALDFMLVLLKNLMQDKNRTLFDAAKDAYERTMKPWHPWFTRTIARIALYTLPTREKFLRDMKLEGEAYDETAWELIRNIEEIVNNLNQLYTVNSLHNLY